MSWFDFGETPESNENATGTYLYGGGTDSQEDSGGFLTDLLSGVKGIVDSGSKAMSEGESLLKTLTGSGGKSDMEKAAETDNKNTGGGFSLSNIDPTTLAVIAIIAIIALK